MSDALLLYRLSGWSQDIVWLVLCWVALKKRSYWKGYKVYFLAYILCISFLELVYTVTALVLTNNLFLDYFYLTIEFVLLGFFLKGTISKKWVDYFVITASICFVLFQVFNAFWGQGLTNYNSYGTFISNVYLSGLAILALTELFRSKLNKSLFINPISWLALGILLIFSSIIIFDYLYGLTVPYKNDLMLYGILITQNVLKSFYLLTFFKGISLL